MFVMFSPGPSTASSVLVQSRRFCGRLAGWAAVLQPGPSLTWCRADVIVSFTDFSEHAGRLLMLHLAVILLFPWANPGNWVEDQPPAKAGAAVLPAPLTLTARQDHQLMLEQLKIPASVMRRGPDGMNRNAPNYQNTDEARANPWPHLPEMMVTKSRQPVTTPELWWQVRRPEIVEYFDAEVYGRVPREVPKVTWEMAPPDDGRAGGRGFGGRSDNPTVPT